MKTQMQSLFTTISKTELNELTKEVRETIATEAEGLQKVFGATDLWNIQRKKNRASLRRREWIQAGF